MQERLSLVMRGREPDPVLLQQLTLLASASTAPTRLAWWRRAAPRSGAVAVAGVLAMTGAAYADQAQWTPPQQVAVASSLTQAKPVDEAAHAAELPLVGVAVVLPPVIAETDVSQGETQVGHGGKVKLKGRTHGEAQKKAKGHAQAKHLGHAKIEHQGKAKGHAEGQRRNHGHSRDAKR